ncbi:MAG TPA: hypothetical protein DD979_00335 [Gammaproteobacteria bacterium]|nr:hypothetical protein [Gammaproteobacteria bacterium]
MNTVVVNRNALAWSLLSLRLGVFIVMAMWTLNKFLNPASTARVFEVFYGFPGLSVIASNAIGILQGLVVIAFLIGFKKRGATAIILLMHLVSTVTSFPRYLDAWTSPNLLFFAAWPMLAAIVALYVLRDHDTLFSIDSKVSNAPPSDATPEPGLEG